MNRPANRKLIIGILALAAMVSNGCAKQRFEAQPEPSSVTQTSTPTPNTPRSVTKTIGASKVDVLIVNDNSGSMSVMQSRLAGAFDSFIDALSRDQYGNANGRDWRLAITTTDVYTTQGNLLDLGGGIKYITSSKQRSTAKSMFINTIYRPETVACEQSGYNSSSCPTSDERGTYAAYLAMSKNEGGWLRSDAATVVIFLANEDVRSDASIYNNIPGYGLETGDRPETLIGLFTAGGVYSGKIFQAHSIIIVPPGSPNHDSGCLANQTTAQTRGYYGNIYRDTTNGTIARGWGGTINNICASNYAPIAQNIAASSNSADYFAQLPCDVKNNNVQVTWSPANSNITASYDPTTRIVSIMPINSANAIPSGTTWTASYTCQ